MTRPTRSLGRRRTGGRCSGCSPWPSGCRRCVTDAIRSTTSDEETLYLSQRATGRVVFTQRPLASDLYWIRAIQYFGGRTKDAKERFDDALEPPPALAAENARHVRPPVSAARHHDDARSAVQHRVPVRRHLPVRVVSAWARPARSGGRAPGEGSRARCQTSGSTGRTSGSCTTGTSTTIRRRPRRSSAARRLPARPGGCSRSRRRTLAKGGDRSASRLLWKQMYDTANNDYARNAAPDQAPAARRDRDHRAAAAGRRRVRQPYRRASVTDWGPLISAGVPSAASRSIPPACRTSSRRPRAFSCRRARRSSRCRSSPARGAARD